MARAPKFTSIPAFGEIRTSPRMDGSASQPDSHRRSCILFDAWTRMSGSPRCGGGRAALEATFQTLHPGRRSEGWVGNCVAVGLRPGFDPIHDGPACLQLSVVHLLSLFPIGGEYAAERAEYKPHHAFVPRTHSRFSMRVLFAHPFDGEFWRQARSLAAPAPDPQGQHFPRARRCAHGGNHSCRKAGRRSFTGFGVARDLAASHRSYSARIVFERNFAASTSSFAQGVGAAHAR